MKHRLASFIAALALLVQGYALALPCGSDDGCCPPQDCAFACAVVAAPQPAAPQVAAYATLVVHAPEPAVPAPRSAHSFQPLRPPIA